VEKKFQKGKRTAWSISTVKVGQGKGTGGRRKDKKKKEVGARVRKNIKNGRTSLGVTLRHAESGKKTAGTNLPSSKKTKSREFGRTDEEKKGQGQREVVTPRGMRWGGKTGKKHTIRP